MIGPEIFCCHSEHSETCAFKLSNGIVIGVEVILLHHFLLPSLSYCSIFSAFAHSEKLQCGLVGCMVDGGEAALSWAFFPPLLGFFEEPMSL